MRIGRPAHLTRWLTGAVGVVVAVTVVLVAAPAGASTTVPADLALSGVVTTKSPLGGSVVGVHPGDSVDFKAAPASVSTQGLNSLGVPLGDILGGLLGQVVGYQVVLHLPASFPGGARDVRLGACGGAADLKIAFPKAGTYNFTWSAYSITVLPLLGCQLNSINLNGNELAQAGIALNASNQWVGKVVAATDPPPGGLSVQLPGVTVAPKVGPVQLPSLGAPGVNVPTLPVTPPSVGAPTPPNGPAPAPSHITYQPPGQSVEDKVMPKGYGCCDEGHRADGAGGGGLLQSVPGVSNRSGGAQAVSGLLPTGQAVPTHAGRPVNLAANKAPAGQMPVLLAILAIIALSLVTATYARLYLLRRNVT